MKKELEVGDVLFTQGTIMGCPYPMFYKVVQVCKGHYRLESLANSRNYAKVHKKTLKEFDYYCGPQRTFVRIEQEKLTDEIIALVQGAWAFAKFAAKANQYIDNANKALMAANAALQDARNIPSIRIEANG